MTSIRFSGFVFACLLLATPGLVMAQGFQIEKVLSTDGKILPLVTDSNALGESLTIHYNNNRGRIQDAIRGQLGAGNLIAKGVTLYNINVQLGNATTKFISNNQMEVTINGNHLYAKSTTPTALGKWADPAFELNFNIRCVVTFTLPTMTRPRIDVTSAVVQVPWLQLTNRNVSGGVMMVVASVGNFFIKTFSGRNLIESKLAPFLTRDVTDILNRRLVRVNDFLARAAQEGYTRPKTIAKVSDNLIKVLMEKKPIKAIGKRKPTSASTAAVEAAKLKAGQAAQSAQLSDVMKVQQAALKHAEMIKKLQQQTVPKTPVGPIVK